MPKTDYITRDLAKESAAASALMVALATDDEELAAGMIEGETSLLEALERAISEIDDCEITEAGCEAQIKKLASRKDRATKRKDIVRAAMEQALLVADQKRLKLPTATLTIKIVKPKIHEIDESKLPSKYFKQQEPKLDRVALNKDISANEAPPAGVTMTNGGISLQIRRA